MCKHGLPGRIEDESDLHKTGTETFYIRVYLI